MKSEFNYQAQKDYLIEFIQDLPSSVNDQMNFRMIYKFKNNKTEITGMGPASFFLMTTSWPKLICIYAHSAGLKQRASLLSIWIAMALLLLLAFNISFKRDRESLRPV
jgi:hypothetical protein